MKCRCMTENKTCQPDTRARCFQPRNGAPVDIACWNVHNREREISEMSRFASAVSVNWLRMHLFIYRHHDARSATKLHFTQTRHAAQRE